MIFHDFELFVESACLVEYLPRDCDHDARRMRFLCIGCQKINEIVAHVVDYLLLPARREAVDGASPSDNFLAFEILFYCFEQVRENYRIRVKEKNHVAASCLSSGIPAERCRAAPCRYYFRSVFFCYLDSAVCRIRVRHDYLEWLLLPYVEQRRFKIFPFVERRNDD